MKPVEKIWTLEHNGQFDMNTRQFYEELAVVFEDATWDVSDLFTAGIPSVYDFHRNPRLKELGYYCDNAPFVKDKKAPQIARIKYRYTNIIPNQGQLTLAKEMKFEPNPLLRPPVFTFQTYKIREAQDLAYEKPRDKEPTIPIQTTALEPIIYTREKSRRQISVTMNIAQIPDFVFEDYDVINLDYVAIPLSVFNQKKKKLLPPNSLKLHDFTVSTEQMENGIRYFKSTAVLHHNPKGWNFKPRNVGRQHFEFIRVANPAIPGNLVTVRAKTPTLIKIGTPVPELPMNPLPLRNTPEFPETHGTLFPDFINYDKATGQFTYNQKPITQERLKEIYKEATLDFQTYPAIQFSKLIPGLNYL